MSNANTPEYCALPLVLIEDMQETLFFFISGHSSQLVQNQMYFVQVINYLIVAMSFPHWCHNPHARSKICYLLQQLVPRDVPYRRGEKHVNFSHLFAGNPIFEVFLVNSLVVVFVDAEKTGAANQFYEKFSIRYAICSVLTYILNMSSSQNYIERLIELPSLRK